MFNHQNHKLNRFQLILKFLAANSATFTGFTPLTDEIAVFDAVLTKITTAHLRQIRNNKGIAQSKYKTRKDMAKILKRNASKARVWARHSGKLALLPVFTVPNRLLLNCAAVTAIAKARNTVKALNENLASLAAYNITAADITAINNTINAFEALHPQPVAALITSKTATRSLPALFKQADDSLLSITDLLVNEYSDSHPTLVRNFTNDHRIGKMHVRHTGITAHITLNGQNLQGAQLTFIELDKTSASDILGITPPIRCRLGTYRIRITAPGCATITRKEKITRGHILHIEVQMKKS